MPDDPMIPNSQRYTKSALANEMLAPTTPYPEADSKSRQTASFLLFEATATETPRERIDLAVFSVHCELATYPTKHAN